MTVYIENAKESSPPIVPGVMLDTGVTNDHTRYSQSYSRWGITMENNRYLKRGKYNSERSKTMQGLKKTSFFM